MGDSTGNESVRRERLLLGVTVALAVIAPAAIWRIGRMGGQINAVPATATPSGTQIAAWATRTARAELRTAEALATPMATATPSPGDERRKRRNATPEVATEPPETATPEPEKKNDAKRKPRRDPGTPTANP